MLVRTSGRKQLPFCEPPSVSPTINKNKHYDWWWWCRRRQTTKVHGNFLTTSNFFDCETKVFANCDEFLIILGQQSTMPLGIVGESSSEAGTYCSSTQRFFFVYWLWLLFFCLWTRLNPPHSLVRPFWHFASTPRSRENFLTDEQKNKERNFFSASPER